MLSFLLTNISNFVFVFFFLYLTDLPAVLSYQACGNGLICYDDGVDIGYCCTNNLNRCCSYVGVWKLWYFWLGMVILLGLFFVCVACTRRLLARLDEQRLDEDDRGTENHNFIGDDFPPSYQQVEMDRLRQSNLQPSSDTPPSRPIIQDTDTRTHESQGQ